MAWRKRSAERRPRVGVAPRLLVLVLLPLAILSAFSAPLVASARRDAAHAHRIARDAPLLTALMQSIAALKAEQAQTDSVLHSADAGIPIRTASEFLHVDLVEQMRSARREANHNFALQPGALPPALVPDLTELRMRIDHQTITSAHADAWFDRLNTELETRATAMLAASEQHADATSGSRRMTRSLVTLGATYDAVRAAAAQGIDISGVWFGGATARRDASIALVRDTERYTDAGERAAANGPTAVRLAWAELNADPLVRDYQRMMQTAAQGMLLPVQGKSIVSTPATNVLDPATLSRAILGIAEREVRLEHLVDVASRDVRASAAGLARSSSTTFRVWLVALPSFALVALTVALLFARSVSRPLLRVAQTARAVVDGRLDVEPLPRRGLPETAVVSDAFNALVENLRLMEAKSLAIAACNFDDPVLEVALPGQLGAALEESMRVLFGSIHDRDQLEDRLAYETTHDALTGLRNRPFAINAVEHALARVQPGLGDVALVLVDLDNFKRANDVFGHDTGDDVLRKIARRLEHVTRGTDLVARVGADEFLIVAERVANVTEASTLAERARQEIARPIDVGGQRLDVTASVGIAMAADSRDGDGLSALTLLARADVALYRAKQHGDGTVGVYDDGLQRQLAQHGAVEQALREVLDQAGEALTLHYQPIVDAETGELRSVEALVRWYDSDRGIVGPDEFIPVAEASDLIIEIDKWVLAAAASQVKAWSAHPVLRNARVAVNVSGRHLLSRRLPDHLGDVLHTTGIDPSMLTIEITETMLLDDLQLAASQLEAVRALGTGIAVDDFGTGYTSLAHLDRLPVDTLKIDRSFISDLHEHQDAPLVRMITELGREFGMTIVAEGVETAEQRDVVHRLGAHRIQGYLVSVPLAVSELEAWAQVHHRGNREAA